MIGLNVDSNLLASEQKIRLQNVCLPENGCLPEKKKQEVSQNQGPQHEEDENEHFNPVMEATIAISVGCEDMSQENLTVIAAGRYKAIAPRFYLF